jgi:hypothetical protein
MKYKEENKNFYENLECCDLLHGKENQDLKVISKEQQLCSSIQVAEHLQQPELGTMLATFYRNHLKKFDVARCPYMKCKTEDFNARTLTHHLLYHHQLIKMILNWSAQLDPIQVNEVMNLDMVKILEQTNKAKMKENERLIHRCHICSQLFAWNRQQPNLIPNHYFEHFQDQDYDVVWKAVANTTFLDNQFISNVWKKCTKEFNCWEEIEIYLALKHGVSS